MLSSVSRRGLFLLDSRGIVQQFNSAVIRRFGLLESTIRGKLFADICLKCDGIETAQASGAHPPSENDSGVERRWLVRNPNEKVPVNVYFERFCASDVVGEFTLALIELTNDSMQGSFTMNDIFDAVPDPLVIIDQQGTIAMLNKQAERVFGYRSEELVGRPVEQLVPERLRAGRLTHDQSPWNGSRSFEISEGLSVFGLRKDGREFQGEVFSRKLQVKDRQLTVSAIRDVSARKKLEQEFEALLESAPDALVIADEAGRIVLVNDQTENLFGYSRTELIGKDIEILLPERFRQRHVSRRQEYTEAPRVRPMGAGRVLFGRRKNGDEFPVEISLSPLKTHDSVRIISAIRDISERRDQEFRLAQIEDLNNDLFQSRVALKEQNRKLEKANHSLSEFTYVASHDLQEPLRKLISFAKLLPQDLGGALPEPAAQDLQFITDAAFRMQRLIQDLLAYSRADRSEMNFLSVSLNDCVASALEALETRISEEKAVIHCGDLGSIHGDATLLTQLFQNLIGNALKFHRAGTPPEVWIECQSSNEGRTWEVRDTGIGIKPEYFDRIFEPFKRLHSRADFQGSGIGLTICRTIVERHRGRLWVESEFGHGSRFRFTLADSKEF